MNPKSIECVNHCEANPDSKECEENPCIKDKMDVGCPKYCEEYPDDDKCEPIPKPPAEKDKKIKKFLLEDNECDFEQFNKREVLESYPN